MTKIGLTGISADLSRRFAPLYLPGLPLSGNSARIPATVGFFALFSPKRKSEKRESKGRRELREGRSLPKGKARGKIENGMALLFKILNRKCSSPSPPCFARSLPPRGSLGTRLTIFASLCASTMRQGEATKWLTIFAEENFASKILCRQGEALECCRKNEVH